MFRLKKPQWFLYAMLAIASTTVGCGKSDGLVLAPVEGVISLDGQALANAKVEFNPVAIEPTKKGGPATGGSFAVTDSNGKFTLRFDARRKGAVPGEHSVRITTAGQQQVPDGQLPKPERVPVQYNLRSQLKFTVEKRQNEADFELRTTTTAKR